MLPCGFPLSIWNELRINIIVREQTIGRLIQQDIVLYCRPIRMEWVGGNGVGWRLTAERVGLPSIYVAIESNDLDDGLAEIVKIVSEKLNITETPQRARRKK